MQAHQVEHIADGYICHICEWRWMHRPKPTGCPGVKRYGAHPQFLSTRLELRKMGMIATGPIRGCAWTGYEWHWYYDPAETIPRPPEEIARERQIQRERRKRQRTCSLCQRAFPHVGDINEYGLCAECQMIGDLVKNEMEDEVRRFGYEDAITWARHLLALPNEAWCILDCETSDLYGEMVEIAVIDRDGHALINTRIKPTTPISQEAQAVHHITDAMLAQAPSFPHVYEQLKHALDQRLVVIYNSAYDMGRLEYDCSLHALPQLAGVVAGTTCAMLQYAAFFGVWDERRGDFRYQRLPKSGHRALEDCFAVLLLIHKLAAANPEDYSDDPLFDQTW